MGVIRKTVSISTLGIVPFRSRKELLRRAEKDRRAAEAELTRESAARAEAERRVAEAKKRVEKAELTALHEAKVAAKAKGRRRAKKQSRRTARLTEARDLLTGLVEAAQPVVQEQTEAVGRRARKAAKASRQAAERAQREASKGGRRARAKLRDVEQAMAPHVEAAAERAQAIKDDVVERTAAAADKVKERADAARS